MNGPVTRPWYKAGRRITGSFVTEQRSPFFQILKAGIAAIIAWFLSLIVFPGQVPIFAAIAALLCVQPNVDQSLTKGIERFIGVVIGVSVAIGAGVAFGTPPWLVMFALIVSLLLGWALRMTTGASVQIAISSLLVIALGGQDVFFAWERVVETAIGAAAGVLINALLVAPVRATPARDAVVALVTETSDVMDRMANALRTAHDRTEINGLLEQARRLQDSREDVHLLLRGARENLRLNPRSSRYSRTVAEDDALFQHLHPMVTQVIGMARALHDGYTPSLVDDAAVAGLSVELHRAAHDLQQFAFERVPAQGHLVEPPALTAPYTIATPNPEHWILIGSLMEDLRRIRLQILELQHRAE